MMDFLDPKKKQAYNIRLAIGYVLIGIMLILGTIILALLTAGYNINRHNGQVIQNGLVFVNSHPVSSNIYVNGASKGTTSARLELPSGNYNFRLYEPGYTSWNLSIDLEGGTVQQLVYPFLFPLKPVTSTVSTFPTQPDVSSESPNRNWLITALPEEFGTFQQIDLTNPKAAITTFSVPSSILNTSTTSNSWVVVGWSNDNDHILLKHIYGNGSEYIVVDRTNPSLSFNVNAEFPNTAFTGIEFYNQEYNKFYLLNSASGQLLIANESNQTVAPALSSNVLAYWPYQTSEVLYVTPDPASTSEVLVKLWDQGKTYNIRTMPVASTYLLNIADYGSNSYVAVGDSADTLAYIYQNPVSEITSASDPSKATPVPYTYLNISGTPEALTFSATARFIALQSGSSFSVYDIETQAHYNYNTGLVLAPNTLANWMDGDRITLGTSDGKLAVFDFDGSNQDILTSYNPAYIPAFNTAYTALYTTVPTPTQASQWEVLRTSLIVPPTTSNSSS